MANYNTSTLITTNLDEIYGLICVGTDNTGKVITTDSLTNSETLTFTAPTGFSVVGSPLTGTGTISLGFSAGYALPTTASQTNWDTAYGWGDHGAAGYAPLNNPSLTVAYTDGGTSTIDAASGANFFFSLTANGTSTTLAVSNVPTTGTRYGLELHLTWTAGAITFPASWSKGDALPSTTGDYVITAVTIDGGTSFKIAVLTE